MDLISSRNNSKIKRARALRGRKSRQQSGAFLVEGIRHVGEAVESGAALETIFYAPELLNSEFAEGLVAEVTRSGVDCYATTVEVFESLASKENPQGILAVVRRPEYRLDDLTPENFPWGVALVAAQDPGNVGTILRTLDAVGASGLLLLDEGVDPFHPSAVRASMGTLFWHPIVETSFESFVRWAEACAYHVYGTSAHGSVDYGDIERYPSPLILLMGSEREGLTSEQAACCERLVRLPMLGRATSLNLAVATGVMLYVMLGRD